MKHINDYKSFKLNENWLSTKLTNASEETKNAVTEFTEPFDTILKKVQSDWKSNFTSKSLVDTFIDTIDKSFENLMKAIDKMVNVDDIETVYDNIDQILTQFNDSLSKEIDKESVSESIKSFKNYNYINEAQKSVMAGLNAGINAIIQQAKIVIDSNREDYLDTFLNSDKNDDIKDIDTIRDDSKKILSKISKSIKDAIKKIDIKKIVGEAKAKVETESSSQSKGIQEYKPGTILKYTKKDGEKNTAEVATNQENVDDGFINMISDDGKETFVVSLSSVIGEADEDGDIEVTPEDISNSLEDIKGDKKSMNKLKDFIEDELN